MFTIASVDKGTHGFSRGKTTSGVVILVGGRQPACLVCLASRRLSSVKNSEGLAGWSGALSARQRTQTYWRMSRTITRQTAAQSGPQACVPLSTDANKSLSIYAVFYKNEPAYLLSSLLPEHNTLYRVFVFCIIKYKQRCVRIKVPHPPRSRKAWRPALPSCGGDCLCPVPAAAPLRTAHPFPEYTRPRFLWMECCCRFFSVGEPHRQHKRQKYTNGYGCNDPSFHNPPPILFFPYLLFTWERSVLRCHFFVSARNNIKTLYQISLAKACFLLYNIDTGEPRMQHPWRQREHPFSSDLIALTF